MHYTIISEEKDSERHIKKPAQLVVNYEYQLACETFCGISLVGNFWIHEDKDATCKKCLAEKDNL